MCAQVAASPKRRVQAVRYYTVVWAWQVVSPAQFRQHGASVEVCDFEVLAAARPSPKLRRTPKKAESAFGFAESCPRVHAHATRDTE